MMTALSSMSVFFFGPKFSPQNTEMDERAVIIRFNVDMIFVFSDERCVNAL